MKTVLDETKNQNETQTEYGCRQDEEELTRQIKGGIDDAEAALSRKLEDAKVAAERLLKRGRYAMEDGVGDLVHTIKRHPISFVGIAFATGLAFGVLLGWPSKTSGIAGE